MLTNGDGQGAGAGDRGELRGAGMIDLRREGGSWLHEEDGEADSDAEKWPG